MREDYIISAAKKTFTLEDGRKVEDRWELVRLTCDHCQCSTFEEGISLKYYSDGVLKKEVPLFISVLNALLQPQPEQS